MKPVTHMNIFIAAGPLRESNFLINACINKYHNKYMNKQNKFSLHKEWAHDYIIKNLNVTCTYNLINGIADISRKITLLVLVYSDWYRSCRTWSKSDRLYIQMIIMIMIDYIYKW